ncbi:MAG: phosphoribosylanthranilate isomerase [Bacteroidales bacterium]|nr:phosphoribosylanthranilate isomerase [Bacteroidales bacterium]
MIKVKVCGLTEKYNISQIADTGPDLIGFIFYPESVRYVGHKPDISLFEVIPAYILKAGVFVNEDLPKIIEMVRCYGLDMVQLHGNESPEYCKSLKNSDISIIKAFGVDQLFRFEPLAEYIDVCDYFLFDTNNANKGGSGNKFDWGKLDEYDLTKPFILGGGIGPEDCGLIKSLSHTSLFAVDINSRFEVSPGIKDPEKVKRFINDLKFAGNEI